jgi:preprotein translocase subunit YajC
VSSGETQLLWIVVLVLGAYLLLVRPARKRARDTQTMQSSLSAGDQIMLTSGIFGRVESIDDDKVNVEVSPGVVLSVHRGAIGKIIRDVSDDGLTDDDEDAFDDEDAYDDGTDDAYDDAYDDDDASEPDVHGASVSTTADDATTEAPRRPGIIDTTSDDDEDRRRGVV